MYVRDSGEQGFQGLSGAIEAGSTAVIFTPEFCISPLPGGLRPAVGWEAPIFWSVAHPVFCLP